MNLSLRKPLALLVAGMAFVACSPDSENSPLSPPLGEAVVDADGVRIDVCKVALLQGTNDPDPAALGEYDFTYSIDGGPEMELKLDAVSQFPSVPGDGTPDCLTNSKPIVVPQGATSLVITEYTEYLDGGYAMLDLISTTGSGGVPCASTKTYVNDGTVAGFVTIDFADGNCGEDFSKVFFKNHFVPVDEPGGEGCTPGGWRNNYDGSASPNDWWDNNPLDPGHSFATTWGIDAGDLVALGLPGDLTLLQALNIDSGKDGLNFLKHATAALLNSLDPDVDYPYTEGEVRDMFAEGFALLPGDGAEDIKNMFDEANNLGCTQ